MKKIFYLFLALAVPGLIFVFLKYGASNRFDIPVYPLANKPLPSDCAGEVSAPYTVPDSVWHFVDRSKTGTLLIFNNNIIFYKIHAEIREELGDVVSVRAGSELALDSMEQVRWSSCVFLLRPPLQSVLLDSLGQIRGQYDLRGRDELDRLRAEIKILALSN